MNVRPFVSDSPFCGPERQNRVRGIDLPALIAQLTAGTPRRGIRDTLQQGGVSPRSSRGPLPEVLS